MIINITLSLQVIQEYIKSSKIVGFINLKVLYLVHNCGNVQIVLWIKYTIEKLHSSVFQSLANHTS